MLGVDGIQFIITPEQAEIIAKHFNMSIDELDEYEIAGYLDQIIDELA